MILYETMYLAIILHFICDWILQPREIAKEKSKKCTSLLKHIIFNIVPYIFIVGVSMLLEFKFLMIFIAINVLTHTIIDWFLPRLLDNKTERGMVNMVAIDQVLHLLILFYTIFKFGGTCII